MTIAQNWFIVYWTSQYDDHTTASVPVKKFVSTLFTRWVNLIWPAQVPFDIWRSTPSRSDALCNVLDRLSRRISSSIPHDPQDARSVNPHLYFPVSLNFDQLFFLITVLSPHRWLDTTPVSRITTRCSQDMQAIDTSIPALLHSVAEFSISITISIGMVVYASGWIMLLPAIGILLVGLGCGHVYMKAQLPVKRLMSNARAPLLGHMGATLHGIGSSS